VEIVLKPTIDALVEEGAASSSCVDYSLPREVLLESVEKTHQPPKSLCVSARFQISAPFRANIHQELLEVRLICKRA
jgi:hypothetical protein